MNVEVLDDVRSKIERKVHVARMELIEGKGRLSEHGAAIAHRGAGRHAVEGKPGVGELDLLLQVVLVFDRKGQRRQIPAALLCGHNVIADGQFFELVGESPSCE